MNYKHTILCVDDEQHNLDALRRALRKEYNILTALCGQEGLDLLKENTVSLIISDQRMPQMTGVQFLEKTIDHNPDIIRIILTGFTDVEDLIGAINTGRVYRYITKPWDPNDLKITVKRALESLELNQENRRLFDDILRLEKLATVGQVASGIAHEVKNQISVFMGIQMLQEKYPDDRMVQRLTGRVVKAKDRILNLLDEIKQYGKQKEEALDLHPTPIHILMEDTLAIVSLDPDVHGMEVTPSFAEGFSVSCDKNKIIQILINLIRNAAQAMNKTGTIFLNVKEEGNFALIEVVDHGPGIPPDHIEQIWKPFFTTKGDEGTGLGLAICQKIAEAHKGRLHCESTVGEGTTFTLSLPKP